MRKRRGEVSFIFCELATVGGILPRSTRPKQGNMRSEREERGWNLRSSEFELLCGLGDIFNPII